MPDQIATMLAAVLEQVFRQGVNVTPTEDGWLVRLADAASDDKKALYPLDEGEQAQARRSW